MRWELNADVDHSRRSTGRPSCCSRTRAPTSVPPCEQRVAREQKSDGVRFVVPSAHTHGTAAAPVVGWGPRGEAAAISEHPCATSRRRAVPVAPMLRTRRRSPRTAVRFGHAGARATRAGRSMPHPLGRFLTVRPEGRKVSIYARFGPRRVRTGTPSTTSGIPLLLRQQWGWLSRWMEGHFPVVAHVSIC